MPSSEETRSSFLHPASGVLILGLDWLLFSGNALTLGLSTPVLAMAGFSIAAVGTGLLQRMLHEDGAGMVALKGFLAGVTVGIPLPIAGTAVGGGVLALSGLNRLWSRSGSGKMTPPSQSEKRD